MRRLLAAFALVLITAIPVLSLAEEERPWVRYVEYDGSFDDAAFGVESAIIDRGLKVDHVSHVGDMLNRTAADVGATRQIFVKADVYQFCSATLSRKMMEADPLNIVFCPYSIFVADTGDKVFIGHPVYPDGPMKEVEALLDAIMAEAAEM